MKWTKCLGIAVVLAGFVGLAAADSLHGHNTLGDSGVQCGFCKMAHQATAITDAVPVAPLPLMIECEILLSVTHEKNAPFLTAHNLSPPL